MTPPPFCRLGQELDVRAPVIESKRLRAFAARAEPPRADFSVAIALRPQPPAPPIGDFLVLDETGDEEIGASATVRPMPESPPVTITAATGKCFASHRSSLHELWAATHWSRPAPAGALRKRRTRNGRFQITCHDVVPRAAQSAVTPAALATVLICVKWALRVGRVATAKAFALGSWPEVASFLNSAMSSLWSLIIPLI
jgi:hypothetical protein